MNLQITLSLKRILFLCRRHFFESKNLVIAVIAIVTIILLALASMNRNIFQSIDPTNGATLYHFWGCFWALFCGIQILRPLHKAGLRLSYIMLPASQVEKIIGAFCSASAIFLLVLYIPLLITSGVAILLNWFFWGFAQALFNPFSPELFDLFGIGLEVVLIGMCGALWTRKYPMIVVILAFFIFYHIISVFYNAPFPTLSFAIHWYQTEVLEILCHGNLFDVILMGKGFAGFVCGIIPNLLLFLAIYFRLKESES